MDDLVRLRGKVKEAILLSELSAPPHHGTTGLYDINVS